MSGPTHTVDRSGHTYTHPHVSFDLDPQYPTDGWTRWELQEMRRLWRNAVLAAERTHRLAHNALEALHGTSIDAMRASDIASMVREPLQMAEALAALQLVHNGIVHRQATSTPED